MLARSACTVLAITICLGCSTRYDRPAATAPDRAAFEPTAMGDGMIVEGLVEYGKSFPFRHTAKGSGTMRVTPDRIEWSNRDDQERSFSIRSDVLRGATLRCAERGSASICLELELATVTDLEYSFRDANWAGGQNERIRRIFNYIRDNYPRVATREELVKKID